MSRSKVSILSKYVMAIAILALLFSVAITSARYAVESYGSSSIGIESFDVDVKLLDEDKNEVSGDITLDDTTEDLSSYTKVYYLYINNNDKDTLYYKIEEQSGNFCFKVGEESTRYTTYAGSLEATTSTELTLTLSVHPDITIKTGETQSLTISLYAEYQHTETYESEEVIEPEPELDDENHPTADGWIGLSNSNISSYTSLSSGSYSFYLAEDITLGSNYFNWSGVSATVCLNTHTLSGSASYVFNLTSNSSLTIEDCQGHGTVTSSTSSTQVVYISSGSTLTLTSGSISGGSAQYAVYLQSSSAALKVSGTPVIEKGTTGGVYLPSGATINLAGELQEGASIGVTSATSITGSNSVQITSSETGTYYYESAIKYIHSDNSSYKVAGSHSGYLKLIGKDYINVTFAVEGTNNSKPNNTTNSDSGFDGNYYIEGFDDSWAHGDTSTYLCTEALSTYSGSYSYTIYYDMGLSSTTRSIDFVISPYKWDSTMGDFGLGPDNSLSSIGWNGSYNNFNLTTSQGSYVTQGEGSPYYTWPSWKLDFGNAYSATNGMTTILEGIGDFTIVLQVNFNQATVAWGSTNNIVSDVYFIADGEKISLTK